MSRLAGRLESVNIATVLFDFDGEPSGIDKRAASGPVMVTREGLLGDQVMDRKHHGGPDKALYAYSVEDAQWWQEQIGEQITAGRFGENLTTSGIDVSTAVIGEQWQIGSTVVEVAQPRIPCRVFAGFWQRPSLVKEFTDAARCGAYLRVLQSGSLESGQKIEVIHRPDHGVLVSEAFRARTRESDLAPRLLNATQLPESWLEWARKGNGPSS